MSATDRIRSGRRYTDATATSGKSLESLQLNQQDSDEQEGGGNFIEILF